jgi:putative ABC transport system permease protein
MTASYYALTYWDVALSAILVMIAGGISIALRLKLEKQLLVASLRTVVQLVAIGYILKWVFHISHPALVLGIALIMILVAGRTAVVRASRKVSGGTWRSMLSLIVSGFITTYIVTGVIIQLKPWYEPQYLIPLLGMILGNGLTGISLTLDYLLESLDLRRAEVEMDLAHGATRWEAARGPVGSAVRRGMIPIINSMMVVGLVSLPGMMTGQILGGVDPMQAVKYQIVVMFMIAAATAMGCIGIVMLVYRRLFNDNHQLLADAITSRNK